MKLNNIRDLLATLILSAGMVNMIFGQNDITEYRDKIKPNKEYEIIGQDILNVIRTIDSLSYISDSLALKLQTASAITESAPNGTYETSAVTVGRTDTVFIVEEADTVYIHKAPSMHDIEFWIYIIILDLLLTIVGIVLFKLLLLKRWVRA